MTARHDLFGKHIQGSDRVAPLIDKIFRLTLVTLRWKINVNINSKNGTVFINPEWNVIG